MAVILRCPVCRGKFKYDVAEGWPDFCQIEECGADINNRRDDDDVVIPAFLSQKSKNNDKVVRDMMDGSEQRANMAAAMAGVPASEMSALKITDLNDRRDAEIAAKPVHNEVTQHMAAMQSRGMPVGFGVQNPQGYAATAHTGVEPYAGARTRTRLQRALPTIGQAPLPLQITDNPYYRRPA